MYWTCPILELWHLKQHSLNFGHPKVDLKSSYIAVLSHPHPCWKLKHPFVYSLIILIIYPNIHAQVHSLHHCTHNHNNGHTKASGWRKYSNYILWGTMKLFKKRQNNFYELMGVTSGLIITWQKKGKVF